MEELKYKGMKNANQVWHLSQYGDLVIIFMDGDSIFYIRPFSLDVLRVAWHPLYIVMNSGACFLDLPK